MSDIQIRQKQDDGLYHKLYVKTTATQSLLSDTTSNLFGGVNKSAEYGLQTIINNINKKRVVIIKCIDKNGKPLSGIVASGINGNPSTNSKGLVGGVLTDYSSATVTLNPKQIDIKSVSVDMTDYIGKIKPKVVQMDTVEEGHIARFTSSTTVQFSNAVKTVDVCCVGGGGGGANLILTTSYYGSGGGGGGAIVNSYGKHINANTDYALVIGSGGISGDTGHSGGTTTFLSVKAMGGGGAYVYQPSGSSFPTGKGGLAGLSGSGKGGDYGYDGENATISEFDDGVTFYSGGGGGGGKKGGTPNGADGAYITGGYPHASYPHSATTSGIGGGGGGATCDNQILANLPSAGGSGLVAIRFHF